MRRTPLARSAAGRSLSSRRPVRVLLTVGALGAGLALSGCQTQSPIQTDVTYVAADGVPVDLGAVQLRDLVVIATAKGEPGVLSASMSNTSGTAERVAFAAPDSPPVYAEAPAYSQERLSGSTQVQLPNLPVSPGDVITLTVQSASAPAAVVVVPVVAAAGAYATLKPTAPPTTSTPTATATESPTESPTAEATPTESPSATATATATSS